MISPIWIHLQWVQDFCSCRSTQQLHGFMIHTSRMSTQVHYSSCQRLSWARHLASTGSSWHRFPAWLIFLIPLLWGNLVENVLSHSGHSVRVNGAQHTWKSPTCSSVSTGGKLVSLEKGEQCFSVGLGSPCWSRSSLGWCPSWPAASENHEVPEFSKTNLRLPQNLPLCP